MFPQIMYDIVVTTILIKTLFDDILIKHDS